MARMLALARGGIAELVEIQKRVVRFDRVTVFAPRAIPASCANSAGGGAGRHPDVEPCPVWRDSAVRGRPAPPSKPTPSSRREYYGGTRRGCCSPTIPAWKWTRWAARPASTRRGFRTRCHRCANNQLLLEKLRGVADRSARFVCVIALVDGGRRGETFRGAWKAVILEEPRG
jgi:hypothetical protein